MSDNGQQVPLIERLGRVPAAARVLEHTPNPLGYDTASIPVGALCREAAARIAELEAALAAERERREAAEALLLELVAVVRGECPSLLDEDSGGDARTSLDIDAHFARYKKEPT